MKTISVTIYSVQNGLELAIITHITEKHQKSVIHLSDFKRFFLPFSNVKGSIC